MRIFKKDEIKLLWPTYSSKLVGSILWLYPIFYVLYFREIGFSLTQIGFLASAYLIATVLFEIPTGAIADIFGRKFSVITGEILAGIAMLLVMFSNNFYIILGLFFIRGIFRTLTSGADEAWIVDYLKFKKRKNLIHEYYTKKHSFMSLGMVLSGIIGSLLVSIYGLWIIWPVTGFTMLLSALIISFQSEYFKARKTKIKIQLKTIFSHAHKSAGYLKNNVSLRLLLIAGLIITMAVAFTSEITWYPLLQNLGLKVEWFGYLVSASFVIEIIFPYFMKPIIKALGGYKRYLVIAIGIQALLLLSVLFVKSLIWGAILYSIVMPLYLYRIASSIMFQHLVPNKIRATLGSISNMINSIISAVMFPIVGFLTDKFGPIVTLFISGIILLPAILIYTKIKDRNIPKI